jgi:hypothetical protein
VYLNHLNKVDLEQHIRHHHSSIESAITTFSQIVGDTTYTGSLTFDTSLTELAHAMERSGSWAAPGTTVYAKLSLLAIPKPGSIFSGDTIKFQKLGHNGTTLPTSYILANISSSRTDASTISGYVTSSGALFPLSTWYTTGSFDLDLAGIDAYRIIPSASLIELSFSSSLSASLAASPGNNLIQFTGMGVDISKWGITGSISGSDPDSPLQIVDYDVTINGVNAIPYRTGSNVWSTSTTYPNGGEPVFYGLTNALLVNGRVETNPATIDSIIRDWIFTQSTYTTMSTAIQPAVSSSVYTNNSELAYARINNVRFYYTYSGSAVTGSVANWLYCSFRI